MAVMQDGRELLTIGKGSAAVLRGEDDVTTWDDEELAYGRRRDRNGSFTGNAPRLIPIQCYTELKRRQVFDAESTLGKVVAEASAYIANVARGVEEPNSGRMQACNMVYDRVVGKSVDRVQMESKVDMSMSIIDAPWAVTLRNSLRSLAIPATSTEADDIVDAELVEDDQCACGCGQPPRRGSLYFNPNHEAHARSKTAQPRPTPTEEDLNLWRRNNGPIPPPTDANGRFAAPPFDPDPILEDDDDEFIEDEDDDPVIW